MKMMQEKNEGLVNFEKDEEHVIGEEVEQR